MTSRIVFRSAAIAGVASALLLALVSTGAYAAPKPTPNPYLVSCKFDGTFFPPTTGQLPFSLDVLTTALGECKGLGQVNLTGILEVQLPPDVNGCIEMDSIGDGMILFNKKGDSLNYSISGQQCLRDAANNAATTLNFCGGNAGDPVTSNLAATFDVIDGTGLLDGYTGGGGTLTGRVNHCAAAFPFGNSFTGTMSGSATKP